VEIGKFLATAATRLRTDGPQAAYGYLHGDGVNRIKYLGPSFGTKFLYFSGYDRCDGDQQPLILDENVAVALNRFCNFGWETGGWTSAQYAQYLSRARLGDRVAANKPRRGRARPFHRRQGLQSKSAGDRRPTGGSHED
jgi:hypothetical protein